MKSSQEILTSILQIPYLQELKTRLELDKLRLFLPLEVRTGLRCILIKNSKLLLVFNHPSARTYFKKHHQEFSPTLLREVKKLDIILPLHLEVQDYMPAVIARSFEPKKTKFYYNEQAKGVFINHAKDPKLREIFENIRTYVQKEHGRS
ncbi:hypothetical protein [Helicobacter mehlei]|uniref:DUF721 domain-containing protein n=1 Tax=Helicobacter mehlei TaxID=2316080 RepID=A0A553UT95_9HELI|nr:hypothetical protein [Helicobacter mehlei]TSA83211.1 hypothetical protein FNE76_05175 [Helicobacter mehlei]